MRPDEMSTQRRIQNSDLRLVRPMRQTHPEHQAQSEILADGTLKEEPAGPAREEGLDPSHEVVGDTFGAEGLAEDVGIHIVELPFNV